MTFIVPTQPLGRQEFIALMAMLTAIVAFSIDAMLPAMGLIAQDLAPEDPVRAQLIVPYFVIGLGIGTLFTGPLSDAFGRRPVVLVGGLLFIAGALLSWGAPSLDALLAARFLQGLGASGARVVALAIVRDRYSGREMARTSSFVMMVFTMVPAIAPTMGAALIWFGGWSGICAAYLVFALVLGLWFYLRQPETLAPANRRALHLGRLLSATAEVLAHPQVRRVVLAQVCVFGMLFTLLSVAQPVYDVAMGRGDSFHLWFGAVALVAMAGSLLNARLVTRFGMVAISGVVLWVLIAGTVLYLAGLQSGLIANGNVFAYFLWQALCFSTVSMVVGNLNAIALEPMGHLAGTASSVVTAAGTVGGGLLAIPASALFHHALTPILWAVLAMIVTARLILAGPLFRDDPHRV